MELKKLVNLTPVTIPVILGWYTAIIPPSGSIARPLELQTLDRWEMVTVAPMVQGKGIPPTVSAGIPIAANQRGGFENLPDPEDNDGSKIYIVTRPVLDAISYHPTHRKRRDVVTPDLGETAVRADDGKLIAVTQFIALRQRQMH